MALIQLTVELVPSSVVDDETRRRVDLWFEIHNGSACDVELVAVAEDVRAADGSLLQRRIVDAAVPIKAGKLTTIPNPLPELVARTPLAALVYTFTFSASAGWLAQVRVQVAPVEHVASARLRPRLQFAAAIGQVRDPLPPTPRPIGAGVVRNALRVRRLRAWSQSQRSSAGVAG